MLNKGLTNINGKKAVPCDLIFEIFKLRDIILEKDEYTAKLYPKYYEKYFLNYENDNYSLGSCVRFLEDSEFGIKKDISIYSEEYYFNSNGKYQGICKLPNGADIIVFYASCEEQPSGMCKVLYFDGEKLRIFTPFEGNAVNVALGTCLLDEGIGNKKKVNEKYLNHIYPNGLNLDYEIDNYDDFLEDAWNGYAKFLGMDYDNFLDGKFILDWDAICNEIEKVLG